MIPITLLFKTTPLIDYMKNQLTEIYYALIILIPISYLEWSLWQRRINTALTFCFCVRRVFFRKCLRFEKHPLYVIGNFWAKTYRIKRLRQETRLQLCQINITFKTSTLVGLYETIYLRRLKSKLKMSNPVAQHTRQSTTWATPRMFLDVPLGSRYEPQSPKTFIFFRDLFVAPLRKCIQLQTVASTMNGAKPYACRNLIMEHWHECGGSRQLTIMPLKPSTLGSEFSVLIRSTLNKCSYIFSLQTLSQSQPTHSEQKQSQNEAILVALHSFCAPEKVSVFESIEQVVKKMLVLYTLSSIHKIQVA